MNSLPDDHLERLLQARAALDGLSVGDAFGAHANIRFAEAPAEHRVLPNVPWRYTDDTEMACGVYEVLRDQGRIDPDQLASVFVQRYFRDRQRGYSEATQDILLAISRGVSWRQAALRVAPVGAYFAQSDSDDYSAVVEAARLSALVTHAHPEGVAGAIAVAVATAWAVKSSLATAQRPLLDVVLDWTPQTQVRQQVAHARTLSADCSSQEAAAVLGSGSPAYESVPFSLWCAARYGDNFAEAMWQALAGDGDRDTNCAIVGGIVGARRGQAGLLAFWLEAREPLWLVEL
jgi:ADP-ribosylglycohydrolase